MHDMVKWIASSVIRGEFRNHEPSWGVVVDDMRGERRG